jgi:hypothetical protein
MSSVIENKPNRQGQIMQHLNFKSSLAIRLSQIKITLPFQRESIYTFIKKKREEPLTNTVLLHYPKGSLKN